MNPTPRKERFWGNLSRTFQLALLLLAAGCYGTASYSRNRIMDSDAELAVSSGTNSRILTVAQMSRTLPIAKVTVSDPVYGTMKRYAGFWLEDVLRFTGIEIGRDNVLVFTCLDGYQARLTRRPARGVKPLLAIRDLDKAHGWEVFLHGKEKTVPGPFYLVWQTSKGEPTDTNSVSLPWPYQISRIEVRSSIESERRLLPTGTESRADVQRGFDVFTRSCIACHSINLEGGALGPELNIPKNIAEYRDWSYLVEFIKDPSSFRARSKMPSFKNSLTEEQINDVLQYLRWMRERKVRAQ